MILTGIAVYFGMCVLVLLGAYAAYRDQFLFVSQMRQKGCPQGLPFIAHGAMWSDLLVLSPVLGVVVAYFGQEWSLLEFGIALIIGVVTSLAMHYLVFLKGSMPGAHGYDRTLTLAGWIHVVYAAIATALLYLFFFNTTLVPKDLALYITLATGLHFFVGFGSQYVLGVIAPSWFPHQAYKTPALWIGLLVLLALITWRYFIITA